MAELIGVAILSAAGAEGFTIGVLTAAQTANLVGTAALIAGTMAISYAMRPKPPKPTDGTQAKRLGVSPRMGGYGRARLSGTYVCYEVGSQDAPSNGRSIDIVALLSGRLSDFRLFYLHDDVVTFHPVDTTLVMAGPDGRYGDGAVRIDKRYGLPSQTVYALSKSLLGVPPQDPPVWTDDHRGDGIASLELACTSVGADQFQKIFPNGVPEPSVLADLYPLWDPRDLAQDPANDSTWYGVPTYPTWAVGTTYALGARVIYRNVVYISAVAGNIGFIPDARADKWVSVWQNPVLQIIDYLTSTEHGMGLDRTRLIDPVLPALRAQANICDEQVATKAGQTEPRYRCGGIYSFDTAPEGVLAEPLGACDGWMAENGDGSIALVVGKYQAPTVTIDMKHIVGFSVNYGVADEELVNELPITFTSPNFHWRETPGEPWRDEASISQVGLVRNRQLDVPWVNSFSQARRLAKPTMLRLNSRLRGQVVTTLYGLRALGERWITLNYPVISGLTNAVVEVQGAKVSFESGTVAIDWVVIDPSIYDWNPATEEGTAPPLPPEIEPSIIEVPVNLLITASGGNYYLSFDDIHQPSYNYILQYRMVDDGLGTYGAWQSTQINSATTAAGRTSFLIPPPADERTEMKVAARTPKGTVGDYSATVLNLVETEAVALRDRMVPPPPAARLDQIDTLIKALKTAGLWTKLDALYVLAAHAAAPARLNWKGDLFNLSVVGAPVFTADRGYDTFSATAHLSTGFVPSTATPKVMAQDSAHIGVVIAANTAAAGDDIGALVGSARLYANARGATDSILGGVNSAGATVAGTITDARGHLQLSRSSATQFLAYKNAALLNTVVQASFGLPSLALLVGARNGAPAVASGRRISAAHFGSSLSGAEITSLNSALQTYLTAVGA